MLPLDGSELSLKAVHEGITLAKALGSKVTLITMVTPYHLGVPFRKTCELWPSCFAAHDGFAPAINNIVAYVWRVWNGLRPEVRGLALARVIGVAPAAPD